MKLFLPSLFAILLISSCKKENSKTTLIGIYTEKTPVPGRSQLNFSSKNVVVKNEPGTAVTDTFYYSIVGKYITLTHKTLENAEVRLEFQKTDDNTFKIQEMSFQIPENPITYMTFKKP